MASNQQHLIGFLGLARMMDTAGGISVLGPQFEAQTVRNPWDANALLDLSTLLFFTANPDMRDAALDRQQRALELRQVYRLAPPAKPARLRLLVLMAPGDMTSNTPVDCLLENSDIDVTLLYVMPGRPLPSPLPGHDLIFVAIGESSANQVLLRQLEMLPKHSAKPVLNAPQRIGALTRDRVSDLLGAVPGAVMPATVLVTRARLLQVQNEDLSLGEIMEGGRFPIIARPLDSQGGKGLVKLDDPPGLAAYLAEWPNAEFYISNFVDYRSPDGQFKKFRVVLVDGLPFACHLAISSNWMIHYVNAEMDASASKRDQESQFFASFDGQFAENHRQSLQSISDIVGLDYFSIDCAETPDGKLLLFEVDNAAIVHDFDDATLYPYKRPAMQRIFTAFREMLTDRLRGASSVGEARDSSRGAISSEPDIAAAIRDPAGAFDERTGLEEALASCRGVLASNPDYAEGHANLGAILHRLGRLDEAVASCRHALALSPGLAVAHFNLGILFMGLGKVDDAVSRFRMALSSEPNNADAHYNLGVALKEQGDLDGALEHYRKAISMRPGFAEAHNNAGTVLQHQGEWEEAIASYRKAISLKPDLSEAHSNLGLVLNEHGKRDEATASFRKAISLTPGFAEARNNLGITLAVQGKLDEAVDSYRAAIALKPDYGTAHNNLGNALSELGQADAALASYKRALALDPAPGFKADFVRCLTNHTFSNLDGDTRRLVARALSESWSWKSDLTTASTNLITADQNMRVIIERASVAFARRRDTSELFGISDLTILSHDPLLRASLENFPVCGVAIERCLTMARQALLDTAMALDASESDSGEILTFSCALARQCFINEYVFSHTEKELARATSLRAKLVVALQAGSPVPASWIGVVAAYFPLLEIPGVEALLHRSYPEAVKAMLVQQIAEPLEERRNRDGVPVLTEVSAGVSSSVRRQYEENPYPQWIKLPPPGRRLPIDGYLRQRFPLASFRPLRKGADIDLLVAGCGTGVESIVAAREFSDVQILAIDLSLSSLGYAMRKTGEFGVKNIEYAQADIVKVRSIGRTFDVILSGGVLHHLANPIAGLRELLSVLRPGGLMRLGLYSERARRSVVAARQFIAVHGYTPDAEGIRRCRQDLIARGGQFEPLLYSADFYTTSECRDLLFHVQEHRFTIPQIGKMLQDTGLNFIGFSIDPRILKKYAARFPADKAQTDLDRWNSFEEAFPDTFAAMYNFWVQKPAPS